MREAPIVRARPPRCEPLELWDAPTPAGPTLFALRNDPRFPELLGATLRARLAPPALRTYGAQRLRFERFEARLARAAGVRCRALTSLRDAGPYLARRAGFDARCVPTLDLGQTALKLYAPGLALRFPRASFEASAGGDARALVRAQLAYALRWAVRAAKGAERITALALGLPCTVSDALELGASSFEGLEGEAQWLREARGEARLLHAPLLVLNDAELAAAAVRAQSPGSRALVLTIGWGVGAARLR